MTRTPSQTSQQRSRFWSAIGASVLIHVGLVWTATGKPTRGETPPLAPIVAGPRTNTVEVGTVPDAVRPPAEARSPASPPEPSPPPAREMPEQNEKPPAEPRPQPKAAPVPVVTEAPDTAPVREKPRTAEARATAPRPRTAPAPSSAAPERVASAAVPSASGATVAPDAGSFGALGLPPGTQYFARAFARALPVVLGDTGWLTKPLGPAGEASLDVSIDEGGRIAEVKLDPDVRTPELLKRAIDRVFLLLKSGTFSLDGTRVQTGLERLSLSVLLADGVPNPNESADPKLMNEKGHRAPTRERPGNAHLTFNSGRRVEVVIKMRTD